MANEVYEITKGGVTYPLQDRAAFPRSEQAVLGAKNQFPLLFSAVKALNSSGTWNNNVYTINNVTATFTVNNMGYVTAIDVDGTANAFTQIQLKARGDGNDFLVENRGYTFNGCPSGGDENSYRLIAFCTKNGSYHSYGQDTGNGLTFDADNATFGASIDININTAMSHKIFKPMLRLASDPDDTYVPYAMTNKELMDKVTLKKIVESAGNQTWADQLTALNTAYSALSGAEKLNTFIGVNDNANDGLYRLFAPSVGVFGNISMFSDGATVINTLRLGSQIASTKTINTSGSVTVTNLTNETNSNKLILYSKG